MLKPHLADWTRFLNFLLFTDFRLMISLRHLSLSGSGQITMTMLWSFYKCLPTQHKCKEINRAEMLSHPHYTNALESWQREFNIHISLWIPAYICISWQWRTGGLAVRNTTNMQSTLQRDLELDWDWPGLTLSRPARSRVCRGSWGLRSSPGSTWCSARTWPRRRWSTSSRSTGSWCPGTWLKLVLVTRWWPRW